MLKINAKKQVIQIWDDYVKSNRIVYDTKGVVINNIDEKRLAAIEDIKNIIARFLEGKDNIFTFKTSLDSYNKRNNFWGFSAAKGQMFFNQLVKNNDSNVKPLSELLKKVIAPPKNLETALAKIESLEVFVNKNYEKAKDKRKVAKPSSIGYFLSYFWQIYEPQQWAIIYTSLIRAFDTIGIWKTSSNQGTDYKYFYELNQEIKVIIGNHTGKNISNWDAEHAFWNFNGNPRVNTVKTEKSTETKTEIIEEVILTPNFDVKQYLLPIVADLVEVGSQVGKSNAAKGSEFEKKVAQAFRFLEFDVEILGQGKGRNPDAILRCREENTAFLVDAKAYSNGYSLGLDDRAIKEYITHYCPKLQKEGYKKIGFIIVCNSFKSNLDSFINDVTWNTDIKRFILLTSEALLYLLAYKHKDLLSLSLIIDNLIGCSNPVTAESIIAEFDDI